MTDVWPTLDSAIEQAGLQHLSDEISYLYDVSWISNDDVEFEGETAEAILYDITQDIMDADSPPRKWSKAIQDWWITIPGVYTAMSKDDLKSITVTKGKKYSFKRGDTFYVFENHPTSGASV